MPNFWFKFEWDAWRNDRQLRRCSKETRGFWVDCIAAMESQETFFLEGTPEEICREVVADRGEFDRSIAELSRHGAATIEECQGVVKIVSRRLLKKLNLTEYNKIKQREHRERAQSSDSQDPPSKDKSLRVIDSSPIGEEVNSTPELKPEAKILLPANFRPPLEFWEWGHEHCKSLDLIEELDEFITFWRDIANKNNKRTVRGWNATWKRRMKDLQAGLIVSKQNGNGHKPPDADCAHCGNDRRIQVNDYASPCPKCRPAEEKAFWKSRKGIAA